MKVAFRNFAATLLRSLPHFRGKGRIGGFIQRLTTDPSQMADCLATFRMKNGALMRVDLRSYTERSSFWTGRYDNDIIARIGGCLRLGSVAFDVGANIGFYSIPLGKRL